MRRAMEYVRWELDNWQTQRHEGHRSIIIESKKIASYLWQSWKRGALFVLVLALLPVLFPLVLLLSLVGFLSSVPLLCGAATYHLFFRSASRPIRITEQVVPSECLPEGLITGSQSAEDNILQSAPAVIQHVQSKKEDGLLNTSAIAEEGTEDPSILSDANTILLFECELVVKRGEMTDNCGFQNTSILNVPSERSHRMIDTGAGSGTCHSQAVLKVQGPLFFLPSAKLKNLYQPRNGEGSCYFNGTAEAIECEVVDISRNKIFKPGYQKALVNSMVLLEKEADVVKANRTYGKSNSSSEQKTCSSIIEAIADQAAADMTSPLSEHIKSRTEISTMDVNFDGLLAEGCIFHSVSGAACIPERRHVTKMDSTSHLGHGSSMVEVHGEYPTAESVFIEHAATVAPIGESVEAPVYIRNSALDGKDCQAGSSEMNIEVTPCSITPGEEVKDRAITAVCNVSQSSSLATTTYANVLDSMPDSTSEFSPFISEDAEAVVHKVHARYWRDEVEDSLISSALSGLGCMGSHDPSVSGGMPSLKSFKSEAEKLMNDQDGDYLQECAEESEVISASQMPHAVQFKEKMVKGRSRRPGPSLSFASSPCTHQRRLSFSDHSDDQMLSSGNFLSNETFNEFTPGCIQRSVSTSFCSDYTWPSESSEQGFEFLSTQRTAHEESYVDAALSTTRTDEESDLESDVVSNPTSTYPTPDQLTEDWETRRKIWEEESTIGRLVPSSPCMEAHSVEARSMCNPLFEFSTPTPPFKKLNVGDENHITKLPSLHTRFSNRLSALPEISRTQTQLQDLAPSSRQVQLRKCRSTAGRFNSGVLGLESAERCHARSYSASSTESINPYSSDFEGLLGYWWRRDKASQSLTSSPRDSPTASSPAEVAHLIREE